MKNEIVTKKTNTEVTVPVTESSSSRSIRKRVKFLAKNDLLPDQNASYVNEKGLFTAPFSTEEGAVISKKADWVKGRDIVTGFFGGVSGLVGYPVLLGSIWGADVTSGAEWIYVGSALILIPVTKGVKNRAYTKLMKRMRARSSEAFTDWAAKRYNINLANIDYGDKITVGASGSLNRSTITMMNKDVYTIRESENSIYLSCVKAPPKVNEAPTVAAVQAMSQLESPQAVVPKILDSLPEEVEALHQEVQKAAMKLRQQDLSVEVAHGLQRAQEAVQGVMATYLNINQLKPSEAADEDLKQFLQDQLTAVEELTSEHVNDLARQMKLDIDSVSRSTVVGSGLQL